MSNLDPRSKFISEVFDTLEQYWDEWFETQNQKDRLNRQERAEEKKVQMWEWRVEFIAEINQWTTDTFRHLLEIESDGDLIVKASSLLFEEVAAHQSRFLDVWQTAVRFEEPFQEAEARKGVSVTHPSRLESPHCRAQQILKEVQSHE
jgi:hypothetical protein